MASASSCASAAVMSGSANRELGAIDPLRAVLEQPRRDRAERSGYLTLGLRCNDRPAHVATLAQLHDERHLTDERHPEALGEQLPAARAEDLVAATVITREPRHVLDDAFDL